MQPPDPPPSPDRREFCKQACCVAIGGVVGLAPVAAGLPVILDPLRRSVRANGAIRVTTLESLPNDSVPRKFAVIADRSDAWNKFPQVPVGAVYLRRTSETAVQAINVVCPHAGCFVDYIPERKGYLCPCHNSTFGLDGQVSDPKSPSPRGLDDLRVEIRTGGEVWVEFKNFIPGHAEKVVKT